MSLPQQPFRELSLNFGVTFERPRVYCPLYEFKKANPADAGWDLCYVGPHLPVIEDGTLLSLDTGCCVDLPKGFEAQVRGRSSMALRGWSTHLGTIDSGYKSEIKVILRWNRFQGGPEFSSIHHGDKIAQLIFSVLADQDLEMSVEPFVQDRGGFGSSGR